MDSVAGCHKTGQKRRERLRGGGSSQEFPKKKRNQRMGSGEHLFSRGKSKLQSNSVSLNNCEIKHHLVHSHVKRSQSKIFLEWKFFTFQGQHLFLFFYEQFLFSATEGGPLNLVLLLKGGWFFSFSAVLCSPGLLASLCQEEGGEWICSLRPVPMPYSELLYSRIFRRRHKGAPRWTE